MRNDALNPDQLADCIIETHKGLGDGAARVSAVAALGMTSEQAQDGVDTVRDAYERVTLLSAGM
jgi:hypothetical protein